MNNGERARKVLEDVGAIKIIPAADPTTPSWWGGMLERAVRLVLPNHLVVYPKGGEKEKVIIEQGVLRTVLAALWEDVDPNEKKRIHAHAAYQILQLDDIDAYGAIVVEDEWNPSLGKAVTKSFHIDPEENIKEG